MKIIYFAVVGVALFVAGFLAREYLYPPEPIVKWKTQIKTEIVYREYDKITLPICVDKLKCYDTSLPKLEYTKIDAGTYRIGAGLCGREWSRDMSIEVGGDGYFKYYIGAGIGVVAVVGIMAATGAIK